MPELVPALKAPPLVTVAMPIYNAGRYLPLAVKSIINQTFDNWELLIVDDGSTDNAIDSIADILLDDRILVIRDGQNKGLARRLNECIDLARGTFFARMDQDDISYPDRFSRQIEVLRSNGLLDLVGTRAILIDEKNAVTGFFPFSILHSEICARPWRGFYLPHPTWMGRIEWFRKNRYSEPAPYFCEDQELLLRTYSVSHFAAVDEIQFAYRIRSETNFRKLSKTRRAVLGIQFKHFIESRQSRFALLALCIFVGRSLLDAVKLFLPKWFGRSGWTDSFDILKLRAIVSRLEGRQS